MKNLFPGKHIESSESKKTLLIFTCPQFNANWNRHCAVTNVYLAETSLLWSKNTKFFRHIFRCAANCSFFTFPFYFVTKSLFVCQLLVNLCKKKGKNEFHFWKIQNVSNIMHNMPWNFHLTLVTFLNCCVFIRQN